MVPVTFSPFRDHSGDSRSTRRAGGIGLLAGAVALFANNEDAGWWWSRGMPLLFLMTKSTVRSGRWLRLGAIALGGLSIGAILAGPALMDRVLTIVVDPVQVVLGSTLGDFGVLKLASTIDAGTLVGNGPGTATIGARYFGADLGADGELLRERLLRSGSARMGGHIHGYSSGSIHRASAHGGPSTTHSYEPVWQRRSCIRLPSSFSRSRTHRSRIHRARFVLLDRWRRCCGSPRGLKIG